VIKGTKTVSQQEQEKIISYSGQGAINTPSLPNLDDDYLDEINHAALTTTPSPQKPKFLILYGSLRSWAYSRMLAEEIARLLVHLGAQVKFYDPRDLPMPEAGFQPGREVDSHPKIKQLIDLALWADGHVWVSPERHGNFTAVLKNQIDHIPLALGSIRPTQGRTLALFQVSGGSQSFNTVNNMRILGRWMRMLVIPNQSSIPNAYKQFDESGRMKPSPLYDRVVDVVEELMKFTLLTKDKTDYLVSRYSERRTLSLQSKEENT